MLKPDQVLTPENDPEPQKITNIYFFCAVGFCRHMTCLRIDTIKKSVDHWDPVGTYVHKDPWGLCMLVNDWVSKWFPGFHVNAPNKIGEQGLTQKDCVKRVIEQRDKWIQQE
tara:strand:- start:469 stop:804 length:336 start_codon:yes stop_codon:yes gene_type:complete